MGKETQLNTQPKPKKGICRRCGKPYPPGPGGRVKHDADQHPEVLQAQLVKANEARRTKAAQAQANEDQPETGHKTASPKVTATKTTDYREANVFSYVPKKFEFSSTLLPLAKQVSMEVWGWPDYEMSDFVDTFIYACLKAAGIKVHTYQVQTPEETEEKEAQDTGGNSQVDINGLKAGFDQLNRKADTLLTAISRALLGGK